MTNSDWPDQSPHRIYLSPPHMSGKELEYVNEAFESNWIAPVGPHLDAFEREFADYVGVREAVALSSGTAALHLAVRMLDLKPDDEVFCSTLTFVASANPIVYERAAPVFIDSEAASWNLDPDLLDDELERSARRGKLPRAVIAVDLYGQCADYDRILASCERFGVPLLEDAAEALGARYRDRRAGSFGWASIFSFNGNKIITTSGGGMLVTDDLAVAQQTRFLAQQARDPAPHYQHSQIGFNYRMSNILAGVGRAQLKVIDERVDARRRHFEFYRATLADQPGLTFMPEPKDRRSTHWLTCLLIEPSMFGTDREAIRVHLESRDIESRPVWKPLHLQPAFDGCRVVGGGVAEEIFEKGLCLPSGSNLSESDRERVVDAMRSVPRVRSRTG